MIMLFDFIYQHQKLDMARVADLAFGFLYQENSSITAEFVLFLLEL